MTESIAQQIIEAHPQIIELSSREQLMIYNNTLERLNDKNKTFYRKIAYDFRTRLGTTLAEAA